MSKQATAVNEFLKEMDGLEDRAVLLYKESAFTAKLINDLCEQQSELRVTSQSQNEYKQAHDDVIKKILLYAKRLRLSCEERVKLDMEYDKVKERINAYYGKEVVRPLLVPNSITSEEVDILIEAIEETMNNPKKWVDGNGDGWKNN